MQKSRPTITNRHVPAHSISTKADRISAFLNVHPVLHMMLQLSSYKVCLTANGRFMLDRHDNKVHDCRETFYKIKRDKSDLTSASCNASWTCTVSIVIVCPLRDGAWNEISDTILSITA